MEFDEEGVLVVKVKPETWNARKLDRADASSKRTLRQGLFTFSIPVDGEGRPLQVQRDKINVEWKADEVNVESFGQPDEVTVEIKVNSNVCPLCDKTFSRRYLRTHIAEVHLGLAKFACIHCGYRTTRKSHLRDHLASIHKAV